MFRRSAHRLGTTFLVVLSLLFAQLALATYVCPKQADAGAMAARMEAGLPCQGLDAEQPALCAGHSANAPQSVDNAKLPPLAAPLVVQVLELPLQLDAAAACAVPRTATAEAQPPPDPLFLATLRLRV